MSNIQVLEALPGFFLSGRITSIISLCVVCGFCFCFNDYCEPSWKYTFALTCWWKKAIGRKLWPSATFLGVGMELFSLSLSDQRKFYTKKHEDINCSRLCEGKSSACWNVTVKLQCTAYEMFISQSNFDLQVPQIHF